MRVRVDGEVRRRREEGEVMLDDGVTEGEGGRGGRREEEGSVEGDTLRREGVGETRPLLCVEIYLLPPLPVLSLLPPHPLLLPLLLLLLHLLPLLLRISFRLSLYVSVCRISDANDIRAAITITKIITLSSVNIISVSLIDTAAGFLINWIREVVLDVTRRFGFNLLIQPTFVMCVVVITIVITCVIGFTVTAVVTL